MLVVDVGNTRTSAAVWSPADATGTATWARIVDSAGNAVVDASVTATGGGGDIQINSTAISIGQKVSCSSAAIVVGGA